MKICHDFARDAVLALAAAAAMPVLAQEHVIGGTALSKEQELAKQLANPVAALISVPLQLNYDQSIGPARDGSRWVLNLQPVIPIELNKDWNLISRTIVPVVQQSEIFPGAGDQFGLGDTVQSLFLSPKAPTAGGWIWGFGPVFLLPTGTEDLLTTKKWGAGPTAVALKQDGTWTYGMLANHLWSFVGSDSRPNFSNSFVQPFVTYTTPKAWSFTLQTESIYDWESSQWSVPIGAMVSKVTKIGSQLVSVGGGVRYWVDTPDSEPHGWGFRLVFTLLFPK